MSFLIFFSTDIQYFTILKLFDKHDSKIKPALYSYFMGVITVTVLRLYCLKVFSP